MIPPVKLANESQPETFDSNLCAIESGRVGSGRVGSDRIDLNQPGPNVLKLAAI